MINLDTIAEFTYSFGDKFFLETSEGNYVWSDPDYPGGDNTIRKFDGNLNDWYRHEQIQIPYGRCKGTHIIRDYCGEDVIFVS